jgi:hypothetical protein
MEKKGGQKSPATVPLRKADILIFSNQEEE